MPIFNIYGNPGSGKNLMLEGIKTHKKGVWLLGSEFRLQPKAISAIHSNYCYIIIDVATHLPHDQLQEFLYIGFQEDKILYLISQEPMDIRCPHSKVAMEYFGEQMPGTNWREGLTAFTNKLESQKQQEQVHSTKEICRISIPMSLDLIADIGSAITEEWSRRGRADPVVESKDGYISIFEAPSPETGAMRKS